MQGNRLEYLYQVDKQIAPGEAPIHAPVPTSKRPHKTTRTAEESLLQTPAPPRDTVCPDGTGERTGGSGQGPAAESHAPPASSRNSPRRRRSPAKRAQPDAQGVSCHLWGGGLRSLLGREVGDGRRPALSRLIAQRISDTTLLRMACSAPGCVVLSIGATY